MISRLNFLRLLCVAIVRAVLPSAAVAQGDGGFDPLAGICCCYCQSRGRLAEVKQPMPAGWERKIVARCLDCKREFIPLALETRTPTIVKEVTKGK